MTYEEFGARLANLITTFGFKKRGRMLVRDGKEIYVAIGFRKGFGNQSYLVIGFWFYSMGKTVPVGIEKMHMYFRLERLLPEFREIILAAGALDDAYHEEAFARLADVLSIELTNLLRALSTEYGVRSALLSGKLELGLIERNARDYLTRDEGATVSMSPVTNK